MEEIDNPSINSQVLCDIAVILTNGGNTRETPRVLVSARDAILSAANPVTKNHLLGDIAVLQAKHGEATEALQTARSIGQADRRVATLTCLVPIFLASDAAMRDR